MAILSTERDLADSLILLRSLLQRIGGLFWAK